MNDAHATVDDASAEALAHAISDACADGRCDARDANAVLSVLDRVPLGLMSPGEIDAVAKAWLVSAELLRREELPRTLATVGGIVAAGDGIAAEHARWLIELLIEAECANDQFDGPEPTDIATMRARRTRRVVGRVVGTRLRR